MNTLSKRIAILEQANPADLAMVMFIVFETPGLPDTEIHKLSSAVGVEDCQRWTREPGESEQAFKDRAKREVKRSKYGTALLFKLD
jgi:hypothetical protein